MADEKLFARIRLNGLAKRLRSGSTKARKSAVAALGKSKEPRAFALLVQALGDAEADIRDDAVIVMANTNDPRAVKPIAAMLDDKDGQVAETAVRALAHLGGPDVVEPLIRKLSDRLLQDAIIAALGSLGDRRAAMPLTVLLDRTKYVEIDSSDIKHPSQLRDKKAVEDYVALLIKAFYASSGDMRAAEAELQAMLLAVGGDAVAKGIREHNDRIAQRRKAIAEVLGKLGDKRSSDALVRALFDVHSEVRLAAAAALAGIGETQWRPLVTGQLKEDIAALAKSQDRRVADIMLKLLDHGDRDSRIGSILALGELRDERALPHIIRLFGESDSTVKNAVIHALRNFGEPAAIPPLMAIFRTSDSYRNDAAAALIKIKSKSAVALLAEELKSPNALVRKDAARTLGALGDAVAVKPLLAAIKDSDGLVVREAAGALEKFKDLSIAEPMLQVFTHGGKSDVADAVIRMIESAAPAMSQDDAHSLEKIGDGQVGDFLIGMLKSSSSNDIQRAMKLILLLKMKRATMPVIECLGDEDAEVRKAAVKALEGLGEPGWNKYVVGGAGDIRHLLSCADERVTPALRKAIKHLTMAIQAEDSYHNVWESRKNAALTLIALAKARPELYSFDSSAIALVENQHADYYTDHSSDCSGDGHTDKGIGLDYDHVRNSL